MHVRARARASGFVCARTHARVRACALSLARARVRVRACGVRACTLARAGLWGRAGDTAGCSLLSTLSRDLRVRCRCSPSSYTPVPSCLPSRTRQYVEVPGTRVPSSTMQYPLLPYHSVPFSTPTTLPFSTARRPAPSALQLSLEKGARQLCIFDPKCPTRTGTAHAAPCVWK